MTESLEKFPTMLAEKLNRRGRALDEYRVSVMTLTKLLKSKESWTKVHEATKKKMAADGLIFIGWNEQFERKIGHADPNVSGDELILTYLEETYSAKVGELTFAGLTLPEDRQGLHKALKAGAITLAGLAQYLHSAGISFEEFGKEVDQGLQSCYKSNSRVKRLISGLNSTERELASENIYT